MNIVVTKFEKALQALELAHRTEVLTIRSAARLSVETLQRQLTEANKTIEGLLHDVMCLNSDRNELYLKEKKKLEEANKQLAEKEKLIGELQKDVDRLEKRLRPSCRHTFRWKDGIGICIHCGDDD